MLPYILVVFKYTWHVKQYFTLFQSLSYDSVSRHHCGMSAQSPLQKSNTLHGNHCMNVLSVPVFFGW